MPAKRAAIRIHSGSALKLRGTVRLKILYVGYCLNAFAEPTEIILA